MQGRKIKLKTTGEVFTFLQFDTRGIYACIVEDSKGDIQNYPYSDMQFVKEEPTFKIETTGTHQMKHKVESTTNDFLEKLKAKIDSMSQEELNASWEAVKDNGNNKVYLTYLEPKSEPFPTYRESMPTLQNTVEVWACMDRNGTLNISNKDSFYKHSKQWLSKNENFELIKTRTLSNLFQGIEWEDEEPKRFRITVEPLG